MQKQVLHAFLNVVLIKLQGNAAYSSYPISV